MEMTTDSISRGDDDGLYFEDELGNSRLVKGPELKAALASSPVRLSILNACWSATKRGVSLIEFLTREAVSEAAIGHEIPVNDESAIHFADLLIEQLIAGQSVKVAAQTAANSLAEQGLLGGADVRWAGNAELRITDGMASGPANFVLEDGFPMVGGLPDEGLFFGRGEQLVQIAKILADPSKVGIGLWGIGGIGKTSLALHASRRNAWRYRGLAWVDIRDLPHKTTVDLLRRALGRLSPGACQDDPAFALEQFLQGTPSLIVLDNLEDLPPSEVPALARFLQQMPRNGSQLLLTGRVPLREVEQVTDFPSLKLTDGLDGWHGPRYLQHVARQKNCDLLKDELRVIGGEIDTLIKRLEGKCVLISQRLHGHPKMLELAVGLALQGEAPLNAALHALPEHLEDQVAPLLATSFAALGAEGQQLLPLLQYFPTGRLMPESLEHLATIWAAQADSVPDAVEEVAVETEDEDEDTTADEPATPDWYAPGLRQLLQSGLLDYDQATDTYAFHQSILDAISDEDDTPELSLTLLLHYAQYLSGCTRENDRIERCFENAVQLMEAFWPRVNESLKLAVLLSRMVSSIGYFFEQRGWGEVGEIWHARNLELLQTQEESEPAIYTAELARQASLLASRGNPDQARDLLTKALERAESLTHESHVAAMLHSLARIEESQGNFGEARLLLQRSRQILEGLGDQQGLSASLHVLARIEESQGNPWEARRLLQWSLNICESLENQWGLHESLHELAKIEQYQGNPGEARRLLQRSLQICESLENQRGLAASLHELARIELSQGNPGETRRLLQRSMQINESLGNQHGLSASLHELARIEQSQGNSGEARRLLQRSVQIDEGLGDQRGVAASLHELANLEMVSGDRRVARELWKRSIRITSEIGDIAGAAMTKTNLAQLEAFEGHGDLALELAREAIRDLESLGYSNADQVRQILRSIEQYLAGE
jgi:tetratricopeptide (TPR) repeat protein